MAKNARIRVLMRNPETFPFADHRNVEVARGNVSNLDDLKNAFDGVTAVFHLAAAVHGSEDDHRESTVGGAENIVACCLENSTEKLFYFSSLSVLDLAGIQPGQRVDESWRYEPHPERRGLYSQYKLRAERLVINAIDTAGLNVVVIRPAEVLSLEAPHFSPAVGFRYRRLLAPVVDTAANVPLVELNDLVEVVCRIYEHCNCDGRILNVVDPIVVSQREYARSFAGALGRPTLSLGVPMWLLRKCLKVVDVLSTAFGSTSMHLQYRQVSAIGSRRFSVKGISPYISGFEFSGVKRFLERYGCTESERR